MAYIALVFCVDYHKRDNVIVFVSCTETLKANGVMDLFVLCTTGELNKYRVPNLLSRLTDAGFTIHHFPVIDGCVTAPEELKAILDKIRINLSQMRKSVVW